jgi:hypothetical protein
MELASSKENKVATINLDSKTEMLKLTTNEFFKIIRECIVALKEDIDKLSLKEQDAITNSRTNVDRQLAFIDSFKSLDDISDSFKEKIYDDFNKVSTEYGKELIVVRKEANREKNIKQLIDGAIKVFAVGVSGKIIITLIKKGKM